MRHPCPGAAVRRLNRQACSTIASRTGSQQCSATRHLALPGQFRFGCLRPTCCWGDGGRVRCRMCAAARGIWTHGLHHSWRCSAARRGGPGHRSTFAGCSALASARACSRWRGPAGAGGPRPAAALHRQHGLGPQRGVDGAGARGGQAGGRVAHQRRAQVHPVQPGAPDLAARPGGGDQGAPGLRAGAPAAQGRAGTGALRGALLDRAAPTRADDLHRVRLPAAPGPRRAPSGGAGEKCRLGCRVHRRSPACLPCAAPSQPGCSSTSQNLSDVRIAGAGSYHRLTANCPGSAKRSVSKGLPFGGSGQSSALLAHAAPARSFRRQRDPPERAAAVLALQRRARLPHQALHEPQSGAPGTRSREAAPVVGHAQDRAAT